MGRRPNLKSEAFSISTILDVEIIANSCLNIETAMAYVYALKKCYHYSGGGAPTRCASNQ